MADDFRTRARLVPKGNRYEDFEPGRVFKHHWGRTITESETTLFSTLTLHFNPHYYNAAYARAHGRDFSAELTLYVVHGWLHLAGYDDLVPAKKRAMRRAPVTEMGLSVTPASSRSATPRFVHAST